MEEKLKKGIWQYLIDHSSVNESGNHVVHFYIKDKAEFWWRVKARIDGDYHRIKVAEAEDLADWLRANAKRRGFADRIDVVEFEIRRRGSCKDKIVLYCYKKLRDYLIKYK